MHCEFAEVALYIDRPLRLLAAIVQASDEGLCMPRDDSMCDHRKYDLLGGG